MFNIPRYGVETAKKCRITKKARRLLDSLKNPRKRKKPEAKERITSPKKKARKSPPKSRKAKKQVNSKVSVAKKEAKISNDGNKSVNVAVEQKTNKDMAEQVNDMKSAEQKGIEEHMKLLAKTTNSKNLFKWMKGVRLVGRENLPLDNLSLDPILVSTLRERGIKHFFPIQSSVIPAVFAARLQGRDVCVSAPTGSGKTLCYVLPILEVIRSRVVTRLRVLAVLPTRDLAIQVGNVFRRYAEPLGLKVGISIGDVSFDREQDSLCGISAWDIPIEGGGPGPYVSKSGSSKVDILVATPGRLVDHLVQTPGFSLQHLRFLVIDEADRLMTSSFHDWVRNVLNAAHRSEPGIFDRDSGGTVRLEPTTTRVRGVFNPSKTSLQKLLFSATLSQNPQHIASLCLRYPVFFVSSADKQYTLPETLKQKLIVVEDEMEKLVLCVTLITDLVSSSKDVVPKILIFTSTLETTHRLSRMLELCRIPGGIAEYSSMLSQKRRSLIVRRFSLSEGGVSIIVCSDALARGLDLPRVDCVVNYDAPSRIKQYVHRVGRTARANEEGVAWTLVTKFQVQGLLGVIDEAVDCAPPEMATLDDDIVKRMQPVVTEKLEKLDDILELEGQNKIKAGKPLKESYL